VLTSFATLANAHAAQANLDTFFAGLGYDASENTATPTSAAGIGNYVAQKVIDFHDDDGSNEKGNRPSSQGGAFGDWTLYEPENDPFPTPGHTDCSKVRSLSHFQVQRVRGGGLIQWIDIQMGYWTRSFGFASAHELSVPTPPSNATTDPANRQAFWNNYQFLIDTQTSMTDEQKLLSYLFQNGVKAPTQNEAPMGNLMRFALNVIQIRNLNVADSIKLMFLHNAVMGDALVAQFFWKRTYDMARPTTPIQCGWSGQTINAWRGPYQGVGPIDGHDFKAYVPDTLVTNSGGEYPCGHCTHFSAQAEVMKYFFNSNAWIGNPVTYLEGNNPMEPKIVAGQPGYVAGLTDVPNSGPATQGYSPAHDVTLSFDTWDNYSDTVSMSRIYLGVHTPSSAAAGKALGRQVAQRAIARAAALFDPSNQGQQGQSVPANDF